MMYLVVPLILINVGLSFLAQLRQASIPGPSLDLNGRYFIFVELEDWDGSYRMSRIPMRLSGSIGVRRCSRLSLRYRTAFMARTQFCPPHGFIRDRSRWCKPVRSAKGGNRHRQASNWRWTAHYKRRCESHACRPIQVSDPSTPRASITSGRGVGQLICRRPTPSTSEFRNA